MNLFNPQPAAAPQRRQDAAKATETPDQVFRRLICEHFETGVAQKVIDRMGPTWYAEGIRRVEAGAVTAEALFQGTRWKLKP